MGQSEEGRFQLSLSASERKRDAFRSCNLGCHPGESRGPYSRGLCLWAPAFAGVTREWVLPPALVSSLAGRPSRWELCGESFLLACGGQRGVANGRRCGRRGGARGGVGGARAFPL